jgi:hypothetical protein
MLHDLPGIKQLAWPVAGGIDEVSPVTDLAPEDYLYMMNWRISNDNKRIEKRMGVADQSLTLSEDIYNYTTYYNAGGDFCQILALESKLRRKVGSTSWGDIHTWAATLLHPITPIMVQGKIFYVHERDSRMVHTDGNDYQIGITPPATLPTLTAGSGGDMVGGTYRYAVGYERGGNYGCGSNPLKAIVGAVTYTGTTGLNDCTSGGTYTGNINRTIRVEIDGNGTPDTVKYSMDAGVTWTSTGIQVTGTIYLPFGVTVIFAATTGHTIGDYWQFTVSACAVAVLTGQKVTLTNIPTSSDGQVTQRRLYRTTLDGASFYWLATINDNLTTTFVDNIPDTALGALMEEDRDVLPAGCKFSCWWDNRLWVANATDNILYYSDIDQPEEFDTSVRYIRMRESEANDEITQIVPYKDNLYVFKRKSIYAIQAYSNGQYGQFLCNSDFGCVAPWSMTGCNNLLMFLSYRGFELYNGCESYANDFSIKIGKTARTINPVYYDMITGMHNRPYHEVWFSCPDRNDGASAITIAYNYEANKWHFFQFHKTPSCLVETKNSSRSLSNYMGTRDGYLCLCDSGYQDGGGDISATLRKGWLKGSMTMLWKRIDVNYEIPSTKTLTLNCYTDFDKDVARTKPMTGEALSATDLEFRRPIEDFAELGLNSQYFTIGLANSENLGGNLKINGISVYCGPMALKGKKHGD